MAQIVALFVAIQYGRYPKVGPQNLQEWGVPIVR